MGICLDTDQSDGSKEFDKGNIWSESSARDDQYLTASPKDLILSNDKNVHFDSIKVPVIFVFGGPGSGKVTHCDNIMQEKIGVIHINMTDLLQQYAIGNDMPDFGMLSSKTVTEVLMLEIKMAPNANAYLISGYPRNMRDVAEYSEKIGMVSGVILISWRQKVLERQIDYGAKLGQVILSLAKMELNNFYKNVIPVADYFDQNHLLISVNGERPPLQVYQDFRSAVLQILTKVEKNLQLNNSFGNVQTKVIKSTNDLKTERYATPPVRPKTQILSFNSRNNHVSSSKQSQGYPPVLWVVGGPGSNKAYLCSTASKEVGWRHISLGKLLRTAAEAPGPKQNREVLMIKEYISNGDMVPLNIVMKFVEYNMNNNRNESGIILDGFPRDINQATYFESRFKQMPTIILLDCSKLQLGRGRLDDSVTAFRKRLEIFRHASLPMLKTMDNIGRLIIVDGDTDTKPVQDEFKNIVKNLIAYINHKKKSLMTNIEIPEVNTNSLTMETQENKLNKLSNMKSFKNKNVDNSNFFTNNILSIDQNYKNFEYTNEYTTTQQTKEPLILNNAS